MARIKTTHLIFLFVAFYLLTCYYVYKAVDTQLARSSEYQKWKQNARHDEWPVLNIRKNKNGSWQFLQDECPVHTVVKHSHLDPLFSPVSVVRLDEGMCTSKPDPAYHRNHSVIVMEEEWRSVDVGYPQYVYTVSGWIQVVEVQTYSAKPALHVIVVPHSHQDVGWRDTADSCYKSHAKATLDNAVQKLAEHRSWKFIWAETAFLSRWFSEASDEKKQSLKRAIAAGQLEIVTGGWVMSEEACAHYAPMLDQLIEGHLWLKEELGVEPNTSWSVDPFGHSPTMAYLLGGSGIKNMVIQRVHYAVKRYLAKRQQLEFDWRQSWDDSGSTDISCHVMPFLSYAVLYSCGPDPHVCCQFDFTNSKCFRGTRTIQPVPVSKQNIKKLAWALWEQYQKKAQLYRSNVILVPHGDDFRYDGFSEWDKQLGNMEKLMDFMNGDRDMNIKVEFGTLSDYFRAVAADGSKDKTSNAPKPPTFVGDFFPYNDRDDQYWTGFYSSRPLFKYMARVLQGRLRSVEVLYTVVLAQMVEKKKEDLVKTLYNSYGSLQDARRDQATFMHHDAITGTSKKNVVKDYANILHRALNKVNAIFNLLLSVALTQSTRSQHQFRMNEHWPVATGPPVQQEAELTIRTIMVTNPLTTDWVYVVKVHVLDPNMRVTNRDGELVRQQVNPVWNKDLAVAEFVMEIVFEAEVLALSTRTYRLEVQRASTTGYASVSLHGIDMDTFTHSTRLPFQVSRSAEEMFTIENQMITATFSSCTGTMQYIMRKSDDLGHKVGVKFMTYSTGSWSNPFKDKSGAYIFMPDGPAQDTEVKYPQMIVVEGTLSSSVYTYLPGVLHVTTLYNISGPVGAGVHVENQVDLADAAWDNKELVMRLVSDLDNPDSDVCVDLNGFQMTRKQWRGKQLIQGNFHPANTMAFIDDNRRSRLTLVMAQAHGLASLNFGWLEVVLDRRMMQDDWRGLGEGISDNTPTPSKFVILLENRDRPVVKTRLLSSYCRPSLLAELTSEHMNNPPVVTLSHLEMTTLIDHGIHTLLEMPLPCSLNLVNLRTVWVAQDLTLVKALMVVQHAGVDCNFSEVHMPCEVKSKLQMKLFKGTRLWRAVETRLTAAAQEAVPRSMREVEIPEMELRTYKLTFS